VTEIRDLRGGIESQSGTDILVTGNTAVGIDISGKLAGALPVFLLLVVGLSFLLLTIAFRSLLVPLKATLGSCSVSEPPSGRWSRSSSGGGSRPPSASTAPARSSASCRSS